ncbi:MAG: phosphoglycerate kinase [Candidatus Aerophobetes bacterium]|nr:phosphoglycerate kinase [Candidatus Aerophobetes bacterium]
MRKLSVEDLDLRGKQVLMRADFNVPLDKEGKITDDTRIRAALPTIKYILDKGASLILISHLGRPKGEVVQRLRLDPVARKLGELLRKKVLKLDDCAGEKVKKVAELMKPEEIVLLENLRFHKEERENHPQFSKELASLADIFVNDAFGTAHRAHSSTVGVAKFLPAAAGFLMREELEVLGRILTKPQIPFVAILGGAKISDKIGVLRNLLTRCEDILIGGGMAYTFLKSKGIPIGKSLCEDERIDESRRIMDEAFSRGCTISLPLDHIIAREPEEGAEVKEVEQDEIPPDWMALDIGPRTIELFEKVIRKAKTIFWNGPMGMFEIEDFSKGTEAIAKMLAESEATTIVGGGDSIAALKKMGLEGKMTHISTGGGASLKFLEGKILPGVEALSEKE